MQALDANPTVIPTINVHILPHTLAQNELISGFYMIADV